MAPACLADPLTAAINQPIAKSAATEASRTTAQRSVAPEATLLRFGGLALAMGITRIGNVTGLDDIGIPAFIATRPASLSVAVAMGKGATAAAARASALMEAAEGFHGECIQGRFRRTRERALRHAGALVVGPDALSRSPTAYDDASEIDWIEGVELLRERPCWVPAGSVHTECGRREPVLVGSNGLAAGNHLAEAVLAGLCEVIERDAVALWHARGLAEQAVCRLNLDTVTDPSCCALLARFAAAGFVPRVWDVTSDLGVATFICDLNPRPEDHAPALGRSRGAGCHPDPATALARALTEAAQSRLHRIAGLRNDLTPHAYARTAAQAGGGALLDALSHAAPGRALADAPGFASDDVGEDVRWLLRRLQARGVDEVIAVDLTRRALGIPVLRVIVPGLEWDVDHPGYRPGARAARA